MQTSYLRLGAMVLTSILVMFGLVYLSTFAASHIWFSQTRIWMAIYMGAAMAAVMLSFMFGLYRNSKLNIAIFAGAALLFSGSLYTVRSQASAGDAARMKAMPPHHSAVILTSPGGEFFRLGSAQPDR
ncbi:DUF305 domain-containing protein [uncultured Hoeflea sp.]|uniref:DUF305 domain-containing protein n=1 Tax=uncultured Hoeflea sp. TaxID=538666 RepID=UPI0030EDE7AB|tara:strand:+ start:5014 stop:5397 length:384 start_codon:yes stop_codon:yes gene_type:complete